MLLRNADIFDLERLPGGRNLWIEMQPSYLRRHSALSRASSSDGRQRVETRSDFVPEPGSADLLVPRAIPRSPGCAPGCTSPGGSVGQSVSTLWSFGRVRLKNISRGDLQPIKFFGADHRQRNADSYRQCRNNRIRNHECWVFRRLATLDNVVDVHLVLVAVSDRAVSQTAVGFSRTDLDRGRGVERVVRRFFVTSHHAQNAGGDIRRNCHRHFRHLESQHRFASDCAVTGSFHECATTRVQAR